MTPATVYVGLVGAEAELLMTGRRLRAWLCLGASDTVFPRAVYEDLYAGKIIRPGGLTVVDAGGQTTYQALEFPAVVGIQMPSGGVVVAHISARVSDEILEPTIGRDVLGVLGMRLVQAGDDLPILESYGWQAFERDVADLYRALGARVLLDVGLAGFQVDILVIEATPSGQTVRCAVECKYYSRPVSSRTVNDFARVVATLRDAGLVDRGVIVTSSGFSRQAREVGAATGLELITLEDLRRAVADHSQQPQTRTPVPAPPPVPPGPHRRSPRVFVIMPFDEALQDVYHLGIREVAVGLGASCERADEMQYVGGVIQKIEASIDEAEVVVAEVTEANRNVDYEVGFAHGRNRPVVLLTQRTDHIPFDLRNYRHVVYSSIMDLRTKLEPLLRALFRSGADDCS